MSIDIEKELARIHDDGNRNELKKRIDSLSTDSTTEKLQEVLEAIKALASASEKDKYIDLLHKATGIGKRAIQKDLRPEKESTGERKRSYSANFSGLIDLAVDNEGRVVYLVLEAGSLKKCREKDIEGMLYAPPDKAHLPFLLPRTDEMFRHYEAGEDTNLFPDILSYLKRFAYQEPGYWLIIACKVLLTYLQDHKDIHYMPMICFYASPERGKSRTGKAIITVVYRGIHVVDMRESNLFRYAQDLKATIFFDLMSLWKKAERNGSEDILLLRYEKGANVSRVLNPEAGAFQDTKWYSVYGPTIIATNESLHRILDTRCISIAVPNKPGHYENVTPELGLELKERLTAWRAKTLDRALPDVESIPGIQGRLWDISKPLLQVCQMASPEYYDDLVNVLLEVAGQRVEDRKQGTEGRIVAALECLSSPRAGQWTIKLSDILEKFNEGQPDNYKKTPRWLGQRLKEMGLKKREVHGKSEVELDRRSFDSLRAQFKLPDECAESRPKPTNGIEQGLSTVYKGRHWEGDNESRPKADQAQTIDSQQSTPLVDVGRRCTHVREEIFSEEGSGENTSPDTETKAKQTPQQTTVYVSRTECRNEPVPRGDCAKGFRIQFNPMTQKLDHFCHKHQAWCHADRPVNVQIEGEA